jgi:hypothetical protein
MDSVTTRPEQVTAANFRQAQHNRWAFRHIRELMPTAEVAEDPDRLWMLQAAFVAIAEALAG